MFDDFVSKLDDPDALADLIEQAQSKQLATGKVSAIGDGSFLKWILANKDSIQQLIAMLMLFFPKSPVVGDTLPCAE